jgi:hypothetical protein
MNTTYSRLSGTKICWSLGTINLLTQGPKMKLPRGFCPAPTWRIEGLQFKKLRILKGDKSFKDLTWGFLYSFYLLNQGHLGLSLHVVVGAEDAEKIDSRGEAASS